MKYIYDLRIKCQNDKIGLVNEILGVSSTKTERNEWVYQIIENEEDQHFDFVNNFVDILEDRFEQLRSVGIDREHIAIWLYYEYDQQCNIEFQPSDLARLGKNGISLCISCWEKG